METSTAKDPTSHIRKILWIIVEKRLAYQQTTPDRKDAKYKFVHQNQCTIITYCFAACCLKMISKTRNASIEFSDSWPRKASAMAFIGILAAKLISTLKVFDWYGRLSLFLSLSLGLPCVSGLRFPLFLNAVTQKTLTDKNMN